MDKLDEATRESILLEPDKRHHASFRQPLVMQGGIDLRQRVAIATGYQKTDIENLSTELFKSVAYVQELSDLDPKTGLFPHFANKALTERFAGFESAARQVPTRSLAKHLLDQ